LTEPGKPTISIHPRGPLDRRPGVFDELFEELEGAGYEVHFIERITESRWIPQGDLIETALTVTVGALTKAVVDAVRRWARKRRREEPRRVTARIYDLDGNVLRETQVDDPDDDLIP